jgi:hypothetical protein
MSRLLTCARTPKKRKRCRFMQHLFFLRRFLRVPGSSSWSALRLDLLIQQRLQLVLKRLAPEACRYDPALGIQ